MRQLGGFTYQVDQDTDYYVDEPAAGHRPDGTLFDGTEVKLLSEGDAYSWVETEDGEQVWVTTTRLRPISE